VLAHVHHKGQREVYDDRRTERNKGGIDKEQADAKSGDAELFAKVGTHPEGIRLEKMLDSRNQTVHIDYSK